MIDKVIEVQTCVVAERHENKSMILALSTKVGQFEFEFTAEKWRALGETAGWFKKATNDEEKTQP